MRDFEFPYSTKCTLKRQVKCPDFEIFLKNTPV